MKKIYNKPTITLYVFLDSVLLASGDNWGSEEDIFSANVIFE